MKQKQNKKQIFIVFNFLLLLALISFSVWKEKGYRKEEPFYLKLAPVDPRSLLQGDYMILHYDIIEQAKEKIRVLQNRNQTDMRRGFIVLRLDKDRLAHFQDVVEEPYSDKNLLFVAFRFNGITLKINADTFLFQEGQAKRYQEVQYSKVVLIKHRLRLLGVTKESEPTHSD